MFVTTAKSGTACLNGNILDTRDVIPKKGIEKVPNKACDIGAR